MRAVDEIIKDLKENSCKWVVQGWTLKRTERPFIEVWVAGFPIFDTQIYRPSLKTATLKDRFRLWKAYKNWSNNVSVFNNCSKD